MKTTKILLIVALLTLPAQLFAQNNMSERIYDDYFFIDDWHTYDYASVIDFYDGRHADGILGGSWMSAGDTWNWSHTMPDGWAVPPYQVDAAKIWIDAEWVDNSGNTVEIQGLMNWDALNHTWLDNSSYDLLANSDVDEDFWNAGNGFLNMSITASERLRIDQVVFMMDYSVADAAYAAAPEPGTIILLSLGLAGGAAAYRVRRRKGSQTE